MKTFKVTDEIFLVTLHCVFNCSHKEFCKYIYENWGGAEHEELEEADAQMVHIENPKTNRPRYFIWLENFDGSRESIVTLSHELNHLTFSIFEDRDVRVRRHDNEVFCYHHDFFLRNILKKLKIK